MNQNRPSDASGRSRDGISATHKHSASAMGNVGVDPTKAPDDSTERWYLRIDDKEYGPITRSQMEFFLRPPRLCSLMQIMCTVQEGVWHTIARSENLDKVLSRFGIEDVPVKTTSVPANIASQPASNFVSSMAGTIRDQFEDTVAWLANHRMESIAVFAFVGVNAAILVASADGTGRDREILNRYEFIWKSAQELNQRNATSNEWRAFADPSISELERILKELQRTANAQQPARQNLLFGGRENLLPILKAADPPDPKSDHFRIFEHRLNRTRELLKQD